MSLCTCEHLLHSFLVALIPTCVPHSPLIFPGGCPVQAPHAQLVVHVVRPERVRAAALLLVGRRLHPHVGRGGQGAHWEPHLAREQDHADQVQ